ncbi:MAG: acetyltransferase [Chitinivorax sp.]
MSMNEMVERIRNALIDAAVQAYEDAGIQGLCAEGRWEAAVGALRSADLTPLLQSRASGPHQPDTER